MSIPISYTASSRTQIELAQNELIMRDEYISFEDIFSRSEKSISFVTIEKIEKKFVSNIFKVLEYYSTGETPSIDFGIFI